MSQRDEQIKVGALVVIAGVIFLTALVFVGGVRFLRGGRVNYTTYFKFAGGIEPGAFVRYGGLKVGTVKSAEIDPRDSTRIRLTLEINERTPVRSNSRAQISTLGLLGENYVEISAGTRDAGRLKPGSVIPSAETVQLAEVFDHVNKVTLNANKLVNDLDTKFLTLADNTNRLITNVNAVVRPENRAHLDAALANLDAALADSRPRVKATLANFETASGKLGPTVESADTTLKNADVLAKNLNGVVLEDRQALREALTRLNSTLDEARLLMGNLDDTLTSNRRDLDDLIENFRESSDNLREFTDTIKQRPFSLIRIKAQKEHVPPNGR
jgi:phospholipid/cholesterol/gamma-HCH transport system substrate-binding protein